MGLELQRFRVYQEASSWNTLELSQLLLVLNQATFLMMNPKR